MKIVTQMRYQLIKVDFLTRIQVVLGFILIRRVYLTDQEKLKHNASNVFVLA